MTLQSFVRLRLTRLEAALRVQTGEDRERRALRAGIGRRLDFADAEKEGLNNADLADPRSSGR